MYQNFIDEKPWNILMSCTNRSIDGIHQRLAENTIS
jgi:hypothetical protein